MLSLEDLNNLYRLASTAQIRAGEAVHVAILLQKTEQVLKAMQKTQTLETAKAELQAEAKALELKQAA